MLAYMENCIHYKSGHSDQQIRKLPKYTYYYRCPTSLQFHFPQQILYKCIYVIIQAFT